MKNIFNLKLLFCLSFICLSLSFTNNKKSDLNKDKHDAKSDNLTLVWADEFDKEGLPDTSKWTYDLGSKYNGWGNNEKQFYTNDKNNVYVENGVLKITALKENKENFLYTSTRMKTQEKFDFKYGRVITRAKLPIGKGTWPAIWMLGSNITKKNWPYCGEIDIMEHVGKEQNKIYGTLHYPERHGGNADGKTIIVPNVSQEFNIYQLDWNPNEIKIYVNDTCFFTFENKAHLPFNENFFLLINFAMGGHFGGEIDPLFTKSTFEVDYIRVFKSY